MEQESAQENESHSVSQKGCREGAEVHRRIFCRNIAARKKQAGYEWENNFFRSQEDTSDYSVTKDSNAFNGCPIRSARCGVRLDNGSFNPDQEVDSLS